LAQPNAAHIRKAQIARCPLNNFTRQFKEIRALAGIDHGEFHDLRRTCLTNWPKNGLSEFDVVNFASHSKFETTRRFYLAVRENIVDRARLVSEQTIESDLLRTPC
jgi:integrase